jgi:hypothetical protein
MSKPQPKKWEMPPIHPANTAPAMSDAELAELAQDIDTHGMHEPIVLWRDNSEEASGSAGPFPVYLLDGRNRLAALSRLGIADPYDAKQGGLVITTVRTLHAMKRVSYMGSGRLSEAWETDCDPYAFHQSMNVFRRHLTPEQRRELIVARLKENPERSNRKIAKILKVDDKTIEVVRQDLERRAEIPHVEKRVDTKGRQQPAAKPKRTSAPQSGLSKMAGLAPPSSCQAVEKATLVQMVSHQRGVHFFSRIIRTWVSTAANELSATDRGILRDLVLEELKQKLDASEVEVA